MKIAFYLENSQIGNVDCKKPELGNPGIGGTQFNFITLSYYLNKFRGQELDIYLFANAIDLLPLEIKTCAVQSIEDAVDLSKSMDVDIFIFRPLFNDMYISAYKKIEKVKLKTISWSHNMLSFKELNRISTNNGIVRHVCVSREQLDRIRDHSVFNKSTYIFNGFDTAPYKKSIVLEGKKNEVTFIGSLIKTKGFHELAYNWKSVLKEVPDAKLNVIGTGQLYSRDAKLGSLGIADASYEKMFMHHLQDSNGELLPSIKFWGLLGKEKLDILKTTKVGIVNPTALSENCPGSALEFQACGIPVVSFGKYGLFDVVDHGKTGLLGKTKSQLSKNIIKLLKDENLREYMGYNAIDFVDKTFNPAKIVDTWYSLFIDIFNNKAIKLAKIECNFGKNNKLIRECNRMIKKILPFGNKLPSIIEWMDFLSNMRNRKR